MTTLVEDVQILLNTLAPAGGVWYGVNTTEPPAYPYIVWQRIASSDNVSMTGPSNLQNTRIQIDVFSLRISEANTLRDALDIAFNSASITNIPISTSETYEDMIRGFRLMREYSVWTTN